MAEQKKKTAPAPVETVGGRGKQRPPKKTEQKDAAPVK